MDMTGPLRLETPMGSIDQGTSTVPVHAVAHVVSINGNKSNVVAEVAIEGDGIRGIRFVNIPVSVADGAPNFIAQAYLHLKSLPEFAGATDC
jgi:hypothetical protein